jgi:hypothetical protein
MQGLAYNKGGLYMNCKCASYDLEEGWKCSVSGDRCMYFIPDSKTCAEEYGEGPDADSEG